MSRSHPSHVPQNEGFCGDKASSETQCANPNSCRTGVSAASARRTMAMYGDSSSCVPNAPCTSLPFRLHTSRPQRATHHHSVMAAHNSFACGGCAHLTCVVSVHMSDTTTIDRPPRPSPRTCSSKGDALLPRTPCIRPIVQSTLPHTSSRTSWPLGDLRRELPRVNHRRFKSPPPPSSLCSCKWCASS